MDYSAVLYPFNSAEVDIRIDHNEFLIGRAKNASYDIKDLGISRTHCFIRHSVGWTICDKSSGGTWLNGKRLKPNTEVPLKDGDHLRLGDTSKFSYVFCVMGQLCPNSCLKRKLNPQVGLDAELAQRRRLFDYQASLQKDGLEKSILENQQDRHKLEKQQRVLRDNYNDQLLKLEERNRQLQSDLEKKSNSTGSNLAKERQHIEEQFRLQKQDLEVLHSKETSDLASKISAFEAAERELRSQNKNLLERLDCEKQQFEVRLAEEMKILEAKFAEQLAEQQKLAAEKCEVEEALRLRIQDLEKVAHQEEQQRQAERDKDVQCLSKEKIEFEKRLLELENALKEKEIQEKEREEQFLERDLQLKAQEEQREHERKELEEKLEAEFLLKRAELEILERERQQELNRHKEEVSKELLDREAEFERKAKEHEKELEALKVMEQERLIEELEAKEEAMRTQLESVIFKLQDEKVSIESRIRGELSKKEGENAEILSKLTLELDQVKRDLDTTSNKRSLLERELEEASRAKEAASKNELQARKDVIDNFGELVESELQCSICNELFVLATTLNCTHTFCQLCISNWLEKKKDCPICRTPLSQQSRSLVLDNFIDKIVENLSDDLKKRRKEIVEERRVLAHVAGLEANPSKKRKTNNVPANSMPLQVFNPNVAIGNNPRIVNLIPVEAVPQGVHVIRLPVSTRDIQLFTAPVPSTSQPAPLPAAGAAAAATNASTSTAAAVVAGHIYQRLRPQLLRLPHPPSGPLLSSAQNRTPMMQTPPWPRGAAAATGIRTRGGTAPRGPTRPAAPAGAPARGPHPGNYPGVPGAPQGGPRHARAPHARISTQHPRP